MAGEKTSFIVDTGATFSLSTSYSGPTQDSELTIKGGLWRNLYAGQEATVRTGHGTTDWFQIGKGVRQGCVLSPCLFNICRVHHEKYWAGRSTSWNQDCRENINNLRYADDTTLMAESEEELKSLLTKLKEESENVGLKLNIQKTKIMASGPIISWEIDRETVETVTNFI